jgi:hypothetical protein
VPARVGFDAVMRRVNLLLMCRFRAALSQVIQGYALGDRSG